MAYGSIFSEDSKEKEQNSGGASPTQSHPTDEPSQSSQHKIWSSSLVKAIALLGIGPIACLFLGLSDPNLITSLTKQKQMQAETPILGHPTSSVVSTLSTRGQSVKAVRDDTPLFMAGLADPYDPVNNTKGYLVMLVAENKLMWKEMAQKLQQVQASTPLPEWIFTYGSMTGQVEFCAAMAKVFSKWILAPVDPQYVKTQAGAGSVLSQLSYLLGDPHDGVLVTAPNYPAFAGDFGIYGGMNLHVVKAAASDAYVPTRQDLEQVYSESVAAGNPPRILIICQPNNPTGTIYSVETMHLLVTWALDRGLHVVSDEIYALSVFPGLHTTSAADVMHELFPGKDKYLGDHVHIVAGLSKDWGMSGFRVGTLFSHNEKLLQALELIGYYPAVSEYTQHALTHVFFDDAWVDWYITENQKRLWETYQAMVAAMARINVPVTPAQGALFAWVSIGKVGLMKICVLWFLTSASSHRPTSQVC